MKNKKEIVNILKELKEENKELYIDIDSFVDYSDNDYICDIISDLADSQIDIYNDDLLEWLKDNYNIIEDANDELGTPSDILVQCKQGQFYQYNNEMHENLENYIMFYIYDYMLNTLKIEEIEEEKYEEIEEELANIDNNNRLNDIKDLINNIL